MVLFLSRKARLFLKVVKQFSFSRALSEIVEGSFYTLCSALHFSLEYTTLVFLKGGGTVNVSSGRLGQYNFLKRESTISTCLVDTILFTKEAFLSSIEKYNSFMIKPAFGPNEIYISKKKQHIIVRTMATSTVFTSQEEAYNYLTYYELTEKYYILQKYVKQKHAQFLVTVQRNSANQWLFSKQTEIKKSLLGITKAIFLRRKMEQISIAVAEKLGQSFENCQTVVVELAIDSKGDVWILDTHLHFQSSKWCQHHLLKSSEFLSPYIPTTDLLTRKTFRQFIRKYKEVVIKPVNGKEGRGIVQISKLNDGSYFIHTEMRKMMKININEVYEFIRAHYMSKNDYIIQQRLQLATINNCPIDTRVIMQNIASNWHSTGKIVKVASENYFVTNAAQQLLPFGIALDRSTVLEKNSKRVEKEIDVICLLAAKKFGATDEEMTIIGFDIGLTATGQLWIIEGNFNPNLSMFSMLKDRSIFLKILKQKRK